MNNHIIVSVSVSASVSVSVSVSYELSIIFKYSVTAPNYIHTLIYSQLRKKLKIHIFRETNYNKTTVKEG